MRKTRYTDQQFIKAVQESASVAGVLKILGLAPTGGSYKGFYSRVKKLNIDTSHFTGQGFLKGKTHDWSKKIPLSEILIRDSIYTSSFHLKNRLIKEGMLTNVCSRCGINEWQGEKLSLHLDHVDGNNTNNTISNLRLLCPNCHSLTPTYCRKN